jgi:hypothetical protein
MATDDLVITLELDTSHLQQAFADLAAAAIAAVAPLRRLRLQTQRHRIRVVTRRKARGHR